MQKLSPVRVILLFSFSTFIASCSSSTYTEKYNEQTASNLLDFESIIKLDNDKAQVYKSLIKILKITNNSNPNKKKLLAEFVQYLDTPYKYGGNSKNGIDCSAFTQQVINNSVGIKLPRTAREQFKVGKRINKIENLKFGDLIYFDTSPIYYPGHVGIYLGKNLFAHASTSRGVIISTLENNYYSNKFIGASRLKAKNIN